ncbi:MAG: ABC transporter permease [Dehalococcoidia bacterium]
MSATTQAGSLETLRPRANRGPILGPALAVWKFMRRKPLGGIGLVIVAILFISAIFAPLIATHSFEQQNIRNRFQKPSAEHFLGTDDLGRDIFSRIVYGARVSVLVGFGVVFVAGLLASTVGIVTGFYGKGVDLVIQRFVDILIAFPNLILLITFTALFPRPEEALAIGPVSLDPSAQRGLYIVIALGILFSFGASRVVRGSVISIKNNQYIEAARAIGATDSRILLRYILPNIFPTLLILTTVQLGAAILAESSLSFLGFGIPPPVPAWGGMLSGIGRAFITREPLLSVWPGLAIALAVFGFNMLGDALRDVLDPRLRGSR